MSYDKGEMITYNLGLHDFGAGGDALAIKGPVGKTGRLVDIGVAVTETFNQVTTPGYVRLGTGADPDAYAELNMAAAADTDYYNTQDDTDAIITETLPADTQIEVALVAPTGGTPAGIGHVHISVLWY